MHYARIGLLAVALAAAGSARAEGSLADLPDPTRPPAVAPYGEVEAEGRGLQSILVSPRRRLAIIDGRTVGVGDRVGDAVVAEIRAGEVILRRAGHDTRLRLVPPLDK